jgi:hypothetical protein
MTLRHLVLRLDESEERADAVATGNVAHFAMPGVLDVKATQTEDTTEADGMGWPGLESVRVEILMRPAGADAHASVQVDMRRTRSPGGEVSWKFGERIHRMDEYEEWINHVEGVLNYGGGNAYEVEIRERKWAARAVREGRFAWMKGAPSMLVFP